MGPVEQRVVWLSGAERAPAVAVGPGCGSLPAVGLLPLTKWVESRLTPQLVVPGVLLLLDLERRPAGLLLLLLSE